LEIGHIQTKSHDYTRLGTVTLFAALDYLQGKLISSIERQHRHQDVVGVPQENQQGNTQTPPTASDRG
jgi:hypothetical protein